MQRPQGKDLLFHVVLLVLYLLNSLSGEFFGRMGQYRAREVDDGRYTDMMTEINGLSFIFFSLRYMPFRM